MKSIDELIKIVKYALTGKCFRRALVNVLKDVDASVDNINDEIGDVDELVTEDKTNLVSAINEAYNHGGGGADANAVHYTEETKTAEEKAQARTNIGAAAESDLQASKILYNGTIGTTDVDNVDDAINELAAEIGEKIDESDVTEMEIASSSTAIADIESDNKLITPAGAQALIDSIIISPLKITANALLTLDVRPFSTEVEYSASDAAKPKYCLRLHASSMTMRLYECKVESHHGTWAAADFESKGAAFDVDDNIIQYIIPARLGIVKASVTYAGTGSFMAFQNTVIDDNDPQQNAINLMFLTGALRVVLSIGFSTVDGTVNAKVMEIYESVSA